MLGDGRRGHGENRRQITDANLTGTFQQGKDLQSGLTREQRIVLREPAQGRPVIGETPLKPSEVVSRPIRGDTFQLLYSHGELTEKHTTRSELNISTSIFSYFLNHLSRELPTRRRQPHFDQPAMTRPFGPPLFVDATDAKGAIQGVGNPDLITLQ